jgi:hypothetical protein
MQEPDSLSDNLQTLELLLVKEFRMLQELIETSVTEGQVMLKNGDQLMRLVEDKEVLLDELSLLENSRRQAVQALMVSLGIHTETSSVNDLLPFLSPEIGLRLKRLSEGMSSLVWKARDINHNNQAVAAIKLDWAKAVQMLLIGLSQSESAYRLPNVSPPLRDAPVQNVQYRV